MPIKTQTKFQMTMIKVRIHLQMIPLTVYPLKIPFCLMFLQHQEYPKGHN